MSKSNSNSSTLMNKRQGSSNTKSPWGKTSPLHSLSFFNLFIFNWKVIALQHGVCFCHTAAWVRWVQFSRSAMAYSSQPRGLQHTRFPCLSPTPGACSNSRPMSWWCHPTISSSVIPFSRLQSLAASGSFPVCQLYWSFSFSISPSSEHPGLISFRMD